MKPMKKAAVTGPRKNSPYRRVERRMELLLEIFFVFKLSAPLGFL